MVTSDEVKKNLTHGDAWLRVFFTSCSRSCIGS